MQQKTKTQYVYAPVSGNPKDAEVYFGKQKPTSLVKTTSQTKDEKDDTPKVKTVGVDRSNKIKTTRANFGLNQEEFAKQLGVSKQVISLYENPNTIFNPSEWDKIVRGIDQLNKTKK